jgi:hypothetical protein
MANNKIPDEDLAWLQAHKQNVERSTRMLKGAGVFFYCFALVFAIAALATLAATVAFVYAFAFAGLGLALILSLIIIPNEYAGEVVAGTIGGLIIGIIIALIYIASMASVAQYPISMQVFYPNHPNLTITQNCTGFTTSESGYINGQPINQTNTTTCILPHSIANTTYPFTCSIQNKTITCNAADNYYIWQGTILNVSKR